MARITDLPLLVVLIGLTGLAMLVPAVYAAWTGQGSLGWSFAWHALLTTGLSVLLAVATLGYRPRDLLRSRVLSLLGAYLVLPVLAAFPMLTIVPGIRLLDGWFEMVSAFTTTGASLYDNPRAMPDTVHLWRALVGWGGGLFVLLAVAGLLAPLNLGGQEVVVGLPGRGQPGSEGGGDDEGAEAQAAAPVVRPAPDRGDRLLTVLRVVAPAYAALTTLLWMALMVAGEAPLVAFCHAASTLATSGISPVGGLGAPGVQGGFAGEVMILVFLLLALTRQGVPGAAPAATTGVRGGWLRGLLRDPELRLALTVLAAVAVLLFLRHLIVAWETPVAPADSWRIAAILWGGLFTAASFLSTAGFISADWASGEGWSGLSSPGLILAGLAVMGGGIATTAGGLKLMRVIALSRQAGREMDRLIHPSSVGGKGSEARRLRSAGAYAAWLFVMLWIMSMVVVLLALAAVGLRFETALIFTLAALTTTGPLPAIAAETPQSWALLSDAGRIVAGFAMILGRLETLALVALLLPELWRK